VNRELARVLAGIGRPRIVVVGDLILDRYVWGDVERISPEAPIPILKVTREDQRAGGAGSVCINVANLGADVVAAGVLGDDPEADAVQALFDSHGVGQKTVVRFPDRPTTVKTRMLAKVQQVLRVDRETITPIPESVVAKLLRSLEREVKRADAVLVSDYNKGLLTPSFLQALIAMCREANVPAIADPARGVDGTLYRGCTAICPNRIEAAEAANLVAEADDVDKVGRRLLRRLALDACIVTRDRDGISLYRKGTPPLHIRARAREVFDVTGAGDMVLSILGVVLGGGGTMEQAVQIANVAGSLEVGKLGVVPIARDEIVEELERGDHAPETKLRSREELAAIVQRLKAQGRTVVFTNGCFDLLNANHISLLRYAKGLGDVLVVATNSDASITRLKGKQRPILTQAERVELLSGVHHVDYVAVFPEDTPEPLLEAVQPDILVKGGDYKDKTEVVGWEIVEGYGGTIARAPMSNYHSTTGIVEKVLDSHGRRKK